MSTTTPEPGTIEWRARFALRRAYSAYCCDLGEAFDCAASGYTAGARESAWRAFAARMEAATLALVISGRAARHAYPMVPTPGGLKSGPPSADNNNTTTTRGLR